jgi:hypothetical protein
MSAGKFRILTLAGSPDLELGDETVLWKKR